ncbi:kinase-like protein [Martensiomyces pterosporus]|nr:kinase-like protein [Martensiomyces pterosporus]
MARVLTRLRFSWKYPRRYHRPSGQVVLYNKENDKVEVKPVIAQGLALPYVHEPPIRDLAIAGRKRTGSLGLQYSMAVCPTCQRPMPNHVQSMWEPHIDMDAETDTGPEASIDREYFRLLERSLRLHRTRLALADGSDSRSDASLHGSDFSGYDQDQYDTHLDASHMRMDDDEPPDFMDHAESSMDVDPLVPSADQGMSSASLNGADSSSGPSVSASSFNQGYYERFFSEQKKLGKGLRGSVFSCQHILDGVYLGHYAVKKVPVGNNRKWLQRMLREVKLLESLRHPNVVEYKHSWLEMHQITTFGPKVPCLFILMEYANGGNLQEYMEPKQTGYGTGDSTVSLKHRILNMRRKQRLSREKTVPGGPASKLADGDLLPENKKRTLTIEQIWSFFSDICSGLAHLHQLQIIHRDLKHMNLLLQWKDPNNKERSGELPRVMLTDFGECEVLSQLEKRNRTGATGTLEFMAPELIEVDAAGRYLDSYSTKSDMWSLGMVLYYLCYSRLPYANIDDIDALRHDVLSLKHIDFAKVRRPEGAEEIPLELRTMMLLLLNPEESKRPDVVDVIQRVNERKNFWLSRRRDAARFEVHDSDFVSSHGGTPGHLTPRRRSDADSKWRGRYESEPFVDAVNSQASNTPLAAPAPPAATTEGAARAHFAQSIAPVYGPNFQLVKSSNRDLLLIPSGASTPQSKAFRRHSTGSQAGSVAQPLASLGASHQNKEQTSSSKDAGSKDSSRIRGTSSMRRWWKQMGGGSRSMGGISGHPDAPGSRAKRTLADDMDVSDDGAVKRSRHTEEGGDTGLEFYTKTAIMLLKAYCLQCLLNSDGEQQPVSVSLFLMGLTLVFSAFDLRCSSLQLSLALLLANLCVVCLFLQLTS